MDHKPLLLADFDTLLADTHFRARYILVWDILYHQCSLGVLSPGYTLNVKLKQTSVVRPQTASARPQGGTQTASARGGHRPIGKHRPQEGNTDR
jgi:hypothetical protein